MDYRNRGVSSDQYAVLASATKKLSRLGPARQSIAPGQTRISVTGSSAMKSLYSQALFSKQIDSRDLLHSGAKGDGGVYGRTPQTSRGMPGRSFRRSSVFASSTQGRASLAPGVYSSTSRDNRPVRDKTFQANCARNVSDYLVSAHYPAPITAKTLTSPTAKEFQSILKFLINNSLDPGAPWSKKFEDDTLTVLKDLKYPGLETVSKTALTAPGAPQSWPVMLAMLNWLADLCKALDRWDDPDCMTDFLKLPASELPLDFPGMEDRLLWDFSSTTYAQWFDGEAEEFQEAEQKLEEAYKRLAAASVGECQRLQTQIQRYDVEMQQLQTQEPPLKRLEDEYVQLMGDKTKFISFLDLHRQKVDKVHQRVLKVKEIAESQEHELDNRRMDLAKIEQAVNAQNLSPDEVSRMNHERDTLSRNLDELRNKIAEASQVAYDQEMMVTRSMDRFEALLADYNALAHQLGLMSAPSESPSTFTGAADFVIDLDLGAEELEEIKAAGLNMRSSLWQALQTCREMYRQVALEVGNSAIVLEDEYDKLGQGVERQKEEVGNLEVRLKIVHQQADDAHDQLNAESADTNKVIAQLETEVTNMLAASQQGVLSTSSQLDSTRIAYQELRHKTALLQDTVVALIGEHIDVIIKAKEHAANSLKSIRALAETQ
ncbi:hypothetical protein I350_05952 [Cryptococcus amylolentus CBS 6273]|uniref:Kinetochore protein NDC80 n=1 Tax=Cryptococcus amylolentus CBS 6273 TaxID=1296118 RepID=A0A1E3JSM8_9TREE|nr:hypothetical protein I350_05952 [Cryptococcus amylolentus CBS 6273]